MSFWNERFSKFSHAYGMKPNVYLMRFLDSHPNLSQMTVLFPGEGQGRNSAYASSLGANVISFDTSDVAMKQAMELYSSLGQENTYHIAAYDDFQSHLRFNLICLVYCHCTPEIQKLFFENMSNLLSENGVLYIIGYTREQLIMNTGGPRKLDMLYPDNLEDQFDLKLVKKKIFEANVQEGDFHQGQSHLIELILKKNKE